MNPRLLRTLLTWAAPVIIGYIMKKNDERRVQKLQQKGQ